MGDGRPLPVLLDVSFSKAKALGRCPRSVYWAVEGARGGWQTDAPPAARLAYRLKQLTSFPACLAIGLHDAGVRIARSHRDGTRPPDYDELLEAVRGRMNALWRADRAKYEQNPRRGGFTREQWYGEPIPPAAVELLRTKMHSGLRRLCQHPRWELVRAAGRGNILICDALDYLAVEFDGLPPARLWAAPDLALVSGAPIDLPGYGIRVPSGTGVLIDWKSGRNDERVDNADQFAVFGWYLRDRLRVPMGPLGYVACIGDLSGEDAGTGGPMVLVGPAEIERGRALIRRAVAELASYTDETGHLVKDRMPMALGACRWCQYPAVCHADPQVAPLTAEAGA